MNPFKKIFPFVTRKSFETELQKVSLESKREGARMVQRSYAAGQINRLTNDFLTTSTSINADIKNNLGAVRERARDLFKNNPHVRRLINLCRANIVGFLGFKLQMDVKEIVAGELVNDEVANAKIEAAFADWCKKENCSVNGQLSFRAIQDLMITSAPRDGEVLLRIVRSKAFKHGIALQLLEPELIDEKYNEKLANGNVVQMGVELDQWRRPVAYWVHKEQIETEVYSAVSAYTKLERIPAKDIILGFAPEFASQSRGMSWLAPGMIECHMHGKYDEAVVVHARIAASQMLIVSDRKDGSSDTRIVGDDIDESGNKIFEAEPGGAFNVGNKDVTPFLPQFPTAQYAMFDNACLRRLSSAWNVSYGSLSNDLSQASYGSNRVGMLEEREGWKLAQQWFIETFLLPVFTAWLEESYLAGQIALPIASKWDKFNKPRFVGRRWSWIDPLKDVIAEISAIEAGLKTATESLAERGEDIIEIYKELGKEKELAAKYGLSLSINKLAVEAAIAEDNVGAIHESPNPQKESRALSLLKDVKEILMEEYKREAEFEANRHNGNGKHM